MISRVMDNKQARLGIAITLFFIAMAIVGPFLVGDPLDFVGIPLDPPGDTQFFGTTGQGQDVLAQTVCGASTTLAVGFSVGLLVVIIGALVGISAAYFGGRTDNLLSLLMNVFLVLPGLPLAVVLAAYLPPGPLTLTGVLVITGWAWNARVVRSQALTLRERDFIQAAIVSGESHVRIITREILPNMASLLASQFTGATVYAIGAQVGLEFLGLGDVSSVTWGTRPSANERAARRFRPACGPKPLHEVPVVGVLGSPV